MSQSDNPGTAAYFDADRPIDRREEDRLGRTDFVDAIARHICAVPVANGFTVAVMGEWGSGKTSVLNMVAAALETGPQPVAILRFNPWLFGGTEDLVIKFFRELSMQLDQGQSETLKDVARALSLLGQSLAPISPVPGTIPVAAILGQLIAFCTEPMSLLQKRALLRAALCKSENRIVVLVDDIDRLEHEDIRKLMKLIRLTSDLPHVVFLLAFDREQVVTSLSQDRQDLEEGKRYLDKIVQVSYDLPSVRNKKLSDTLLKWLNESIQDRKVVQLDRDVWGRAFYEIIRPMLGNLRDVKRYLYSLPVSLEAVGHEVALADLLGLEAIRVLRPSLFEDLKTHVHCLVHLESSSISLSSTDDPDAKLQKELAALIDRSKDDSEIMKAALEVLFPATQGFLGGSTYGPHWIGTWRKKRRVACEEVLRIYLEAGLDEDSLSYSEVQELVDSLADERNLVMLLDELTEKRLELALGRLEDFEDEFPREAVQVAVPVIANRMPILSRHPASFFGLPPRSKASRVIYLLMRRVENGDVLVDQLDKAFGKVEALSGWLHLIEIAGSRSDVGRTLINEEQARILQERVIVRLKSATVEDLVDEWDLLALSTRTLRWLDEEGKDRLVARLREHLGDDCFVVALLLSSVGYVHISTGDVKKRMEWDALVEVFGERLADAVNSLSSSQLDRGLTGDEQDAIALAQKYSTGWRPSE